MRLALDALLWIDRSPTRYWLVAIGAYAILLASCLWPAIRTTQGSLWKDRLSRWAENDAVFLALGAVVILAFRWPLLFYPAEFNPDESAFISQALTLRHDPIFWRSISAGTSGPLNVYPLLVPLLLGLPLKFTAARLVALACEAGTISFFYLVCRRFAPLVVARLAVLPPITFFALVTDPDFVRYSGEHMPMLLLSAACFLCLRLLDDRANISGTAFAAGCVLGAVPFSKLQGSLTALTIAAFCCLFLLTRRGDSILDRLRHTGWLVFGSLALPALLLSITAAFGVFGHFWQSYVVANRQYANTGLSLLLRLGMVPVFGAGEHLFYRYFKTLMALGAAGLCFGAAAQWRNLKWSRYGQLISLATAVFIVSVFSVMEPGWPFAHYLMLLVMPAALWAFAGLAFFINGIHGKSSKTVFAMGLWTALAVGCQIPAFHPPNKWLGWLERNLSASPSGVAQTILHFATPNESLSVWGGYCQFHVETGMGRASRDNYFDYRPVFGGLVPDYFKNLYIADLRRSNPPVFVDAVTPQTRDLWDRTDFNYEEFPPLASYIHENYTLVDNIGSIRVFVRNDRLQEVLKNHPDLIPARYRDGSLISQSSFVVDADALPDKEGQRTQSAYALCRLGRMLLKKGRSDQALLIYKRVLEIDPDSTDAYGNLGVLFAQRGELNEAISDFQRTLSMDPDWAEPHWALGKILLQEGKTDEAEQHLRRALEIRPDARACCELGNLLRDMGQPKEAISYFQKALAIDPKFAEAYYDLGYTLFMSGQVTDAVSQWQKALDIDPDNIGVLDNLARVLAANPDPALRNGAKAIELAQHAEYLSSGKDPNILRTLAAAYAEGDRLNDAIQTIQRALELPNARTNIPLNEALHAQMQAYQTSHSTTPANIPASGAGSRN